MLDQGLLTTILGLAKVINTQVQTIRANPRRCRELADRIDTLADTLKGKWHSLPDTSRFERALQNLQVILRETNTYISKFGQKNKLEKYARTQHFKDKFEDLNTRIERCMQDLTLGLSVQMVARRRRTDGDNRVKDLEDFRRNQQEILAFCRDTHDRVVDVQQGVDSLQQGMGALTVSSQAQEAQQARMAEDLSAVRAGLGRVEASQHQQSAGASSTGSAYGAALAASGPQPGAAPAPGPGMPPSAPGHGGVAPAYIWDQFRGWVQTYVPVQAAPVYYGGSAQQQYYSAPAPASAPISSVPGEASYKNGEKYEAAGDKVRAVECFLRGAIIGYAPAQATVGLCYLAGNGVERNLDEAESWLLKSAASGDATIQTALAQCYLEKGHNMSATLWLRKAVLQNDKRAQYLMGNCYRDGKGVTKNIGEAKRLYTLAAEQGNTNAKQALEALSRPVVRVERVTQGTGRVTQGRRVGVAESSSSGSYTSSASESTSTSASASESSSSDSESQNRFFSRSSGAAGAARRSASRHPRRAHRR